MLRRARWLVFGVVGVVGVAVAALATPPGHALIERVVENVASTPDVKIDLQGLNGFVPFAFGLDRVTVADSEGVFAEVSGADVTWSPGRLLFGEIALPEVKVDRVALARRPVLATTVEAASAEEPSQRPAIALGKLEVGAFELGQPVIGHAATLRLSARATLSPSGAISAAATIERVDGQLFLLAAEVEKPADGIGTATLDLTEAENGLLVAMFGQAGGPAYQLQVSVTDPQTGPEGTLTLTSGARDRLSGQFKLAAQDSGHRLSATLEGLLADLIPAAVSDLVAGPLTGAADISWTAPTDITVHAGKLQGGAIALEASGRLGAPGDQLSGRLTVGRADGAPIRIHAPEPAAPPVASFEAIDLSFAVAPDGATSRLDVTGHVRGLVASDITIPGLGVSLAAEAEGRRFLEPGPLPFAGRFEADKIITAFGTLASAPGTPLTAQIDGDATPQGGGGPVIRAFSIDAAGGQLAFAGEGGTSAVKGRATARWPDLAALTPLTGPGYGGSLSVVMDGTLFAPGGTVDATLLAEGRDVRVGQPVLEGVLKGDLSATGRIARTADGTASWTDIAVKTAQLALQSSGRVGTDVLEGTLTAALADLKALSPNASGAVNLTASARGSLAAPTIDGALGVPSGAVGGRSLSDAVVRFAMAPDGDGARGSLTLSGTYADRPLVGGVDLERRPNHVAAPRVDLAIGQTTIKGAITQRRDGQYDGRLIVKAPQIAELAALALVDAKGTLEADVSLVPGTAPTDQRVDFEVTGQDLAMAGVSLATVEAKGAATGLMGTPAVNATVKARRIGASGLAIDGVDATARDDGKATRFEVKATGRDLAGQLAGELVRAADGFKLEIAQGNARAFGIEARLAGPLVITRDARATMLKTSRLTIGGGTLAASGSLEPNLHVEAALSALPAAFLDRFVPELGADGRIEATAVAKGTLADPRIAWTFNWADMSVAAMKAAKLPVFLISARGDAKPATTTLDGRIVGAGLNLGVGGRLPFGPGSLDLKANGRVPMALLGASLGREVRAAGGADIAVAVGGNATKPVINGTATLVGVSIADAMTGLGVTGVTGRVRFDGVTAMVDGVTGQLAQGGRFTLGGPIGVDTAKGLPANLRLSITEGVYTDGSMVKASFNAALGLEGPLMGGALANGRVDLGRVEVTLPDRLPSSAANLSITHQNAGKAVDPKVAKPTPPRRQTAPRAAAGIGRPIRLDIAVEARQGVFVRGFGLDAELGGAVRVRGTVIDPTIEGGFDMRRGRFEVLARRFDFSRGKLSFAGDLMPELDFVASTKTSDATVSVVVNGPAQAPSFSFQSTPSLPAEEVVSRLLFDRGIGKLSTVQAIRLVDELGKLSGVTKSGIFDSLRRSFGLTDLDIKQDEKGNVAVGIGGQITDNVRVGVEQGQQPGSGKVIVDVDVIQNLLKGRGEVGANGKGKVGITVEREY